MIDNNDINNVKFLYERVPEPLVQASQSFAQSWSLAKALSKNKFGEALALLQEPVKIDATACPLRDSLPMLRSILAWHLTEHTVPDFIAGAYSNIELKRVKEMLGDPANLGQVMSSTGLVSGGAAAGDAQGFIEIN